MNKQDKILKAQIQLDNLEHYRPLTEPVVQETHNRVPQLINELHDYNHIDEMTKQWLCQRPTPPQIPIFYTLTKIHKPTPVGRPIISGCDGPTEKLSVFIDKQLQPITQNNNHTERYTRSSKTVSKANKRGGSRASLSTPFLYNQIDRIKFNQMQVFQERGKPEYPGKYLSEQRRESTNSTHI